MGQPQKLALIVKNPFADNLLFVVNLVTIAVASGMRVRLFFSGFAGEKLRPGAMNCIQLPPALKDKEAWYAQRMRAAGMGDLYGLLREVKELGDVRIFLCSFTASLWELSPDQLIPEVDGIIGTTTFLLEEAMDADLTLTF